MARPVQHEAVSLVANSWASWVGLAQANVDPRFSISRATASRCVA